ncbi:ABC transporter ATP-binding protein [Lichenihabitans sp. PAMC28606]|uniref:ABC transporter ATP-binding protein n=1 Tax=Lichenihabitans sp. PAMC28606 TaxID=2880932 RepID=UPI001D0AF799|nr:ABC transporter ATP-binding protein [Lichenihabitans sp. PAMC28606]UDL93405.1 ABC transporter ATP-binding protein [Lichenihabitans sp. PAMC28606]
MSFILDHIVLQVGKDVVIGDVSLTLEAGTMNVLLGPTLSGKTTLMRVMAGLDRPTSGRLLADGVDVTGMSVRKRSVAMVYQQFVNYPTLTIYENIASPLRVQGLPKDEIEARVARAAKLLRLEPMLQRLPAQLSGGQQQRTAIARALVKQARLVLLDEPLANLDYKLREELREELPRIFAETGAILVYATTEPTEALLLRGKTATLWQGRVTQVGPTASVYRQPDNLDAARVFSDPPLNELALTIAGGTVRLESGRTLPAEGGLAALADGAYRLGFRSDAVTIGAAQPGRLGFPGRVAVTDINGSESFVHVEVGHGGAGPVGTTWVCLVDGIQEWLPGDTVEVQLDPSQIFVFGADGQRLDAAAAPQLGRERRTVSASA